MSAGYNQPNQSPFDSETPELEPQTLPMDEIIRQAIKSSMLLMHVMLPASVIKVNGNQSVDIQPLLKSRYIDGRVINRPPIKNVMVGMPMGADYSIKLPVAVGDTGYALFCDRSLANWSASDGGIIDPEGSRQHDLNDPIFVPGMVPFKNQTKDNTTDMVLTNGKMIIRVQKAGTILLTNGQNELMAVLDEFMQQVHTLSDTLSNDTVNTIFGPTKLNAFATYAAIATAIEALIVRFETLKGS